MEELISVEAFKSASGIKQKHIANLTFKALKLDEINKIYASVPHQSPIEYVSQLLENLNIEVVVDEKSLNNIPLENGFATISNHPFGGIDGIVLLYLILKKRPDFHLMANHILQRITPLSEVLIPVNPMQDISDKSSLAGMRKAMKLLNENVPVGFFPAGEVSSWHSDKRKITDKPWSKTIVRMLKKAEKPIVPIYFEGLNSAFFYSLSAIHPLLQTAKLPSEFTNKKNKKIKVIIGKPIKVVEQKSFDKIDKFSKYLRTKTYALGLDLEHKKFYSNIKFPKRSGLKQEIEPLENPEIVNLEITRLEKNKLLFESGKFQVYCAKAEDLGIIMDEIGKLREITFRAVGEGTGLSKDLDEYDLYYHHMFIWDKENLQILGAYRLGDGNSILKSYQKTGFYIHSLFRWKKPFNDILSQSLELGRSFVQPAYLKHPQSLFLLWKGILFYLMSNKSYRYLVGPVSISNEYSNVSKSLIVKYLKANYYDNTNAKHIKSRKKFRYTINNPDVNIDDFDVNDLSKLDSIVEGIEPNHFKLPVLIKKYLKQNAKFIGFNLDPAFNNCLDGLIILDLNDMNQETFDALNPKSDA
jgi:putative hemolysin